ncbi:hypothetical protein E4U54_008758 [Claviceps lovelessii]|nr:hypothetical protein E4U54_008758 [Claviceps lovelessii]
MAHAPERRSLFAHGDASPSFSRTGSELVLDDSDDDEDEDEDEDDDDDDYDLRSEVGGSETYEMIAAGGGGGSGDGSARTTREDDESRRRGSGSSTVASFELFTPDEEAAVRTKFDRKLVLFVAMLFMLSFLDRSNIGNARIAGMDQDLQTTPPRPDWYEWSLSAFYISYIGFEWMSLLFKLVPAHVLVSLTVLTWGVAASLQAIAPSYPVLVALRVLLGIGEAGFAGIPFYLSFFFRRDELAFRTAIFVSAAPLATSFASTLAYIIIWLAGKLSSPIAPWRLLFLLEGFPSVLASVKAWSVIPDGPDSASYLTEREKTVARLRLRHQHHHHPQQDSTFSSTSTFSSSSASRGFRNHNSKQHGIRPHELLAVLLDPIAWITSAMFFLTNMAYSSLPVFLPKIMTQMGHDALTSQALSAPPYLCAFIIVLFTAHMSDRLRVRTIPVVFHALASAAGYAVLALAQPLHLPGFLRYMAIYPAATGFFNVATLLIVWNINNQASQTRQGAGFALMQLIGQCGPLVGTRLYPDADGPYYASGMTTCAIAMATVAGLALLLRIYLGYQNRRLDLAERQGQRRGRGRAQGQAQRSGAVEEEEQGLVEESSGRRKRRMRQSFRYML